MFAQPKVQFFYCCSKKKKSQNQWPKQHSCINSACQARSSGIAQLSWLPCVEPHQAGIKVSVGLFLSGGSRGESVLRLLKIKSWVPCSCRASLLACCRPGSVLSFWGPCAFPGSLHRQGSSRSESLMLWISPSFSSLTPLLLDFGL